MSTPNICKDYHKKIVALILGQLDNESAQKLNQHLDDCQSCQTFYENLLEEEKLIKAAFKTISDKNEEKESLLVQKLADKSNQPHHSENLRRRLTRTKFVAK